MKVLLRKLDSIVNHTLAQIVAYADMNYNLELIDRNSHDNPHLRSFWISAYSQLVKFHLDSNSLFHFGRQGSDVYDYRCQFPFSWELQQAMESIVNIQGSTDQSKVKIKSVIYYCILPCNIIVNQIRSHLHLKFKILNEVQGIHYDDMLRRYICDLIQLKWSRTFRDDRVNSKGLDVS